MRYVDFCPFLEKILPRDSLFRRELLVFGILDSRPIVDGKRTGFVLGVLFLELHGFEFKASEEDATQAVTELAAGSLDERGYAAWLRENTKRRR
jgi:death on curing protein